MKSILLLSFLFLYSQQIHINLRNALQYPAQIIHPTNGKYIDLTTPSIDQKTSNSLDDQIIYDANKILLDIDGINNQAVDLHNNQGHLSNSDQQRSDQRMYNSGPQGYGMGSLNGQMNEFSKGKAPKKSYY